ncbi:MAG: hypothetical protein KKB51_17950 [Candidatus Riflebacteria bacterium]|nr:hypothetical protein [Candidatus Riflebacteria bacterium]
MSATLESVLTSHGSDEQFGFDIQLERNEAQEPENTTEIRRKKKTGKASRNSKKGVSDITLVKLATVGFLEGAWNLFLYLNLWYILYPVLLFTSFYMSQTLLKPEFATLTPIRLFSTIISVCAGMYYAYYLLITFICENGDPEMYEKERPYFLLRILMYSLIMGTVLYTSNLLNLKTVQNPENQRLLISFYLMFVTSTAVFKYYNYKISN